MVEIMHNYTTIAVLLIVSLLISCEAMSFLVGQMFAVVDDFTHAGLDEDFTAAG